MSGSQAADQLLKQSLQQQQQNQQSLNRQLLFSMAPGDDCHRFALAEPRSIADQEAEAMVEAFSLNGAGNFSVLIMFEPEKIKRYQLKRKSDVADREVEPGDKFGPQTPPSNLGSPGNNLTPAGPCRYDSSLGLLTKKFINLIKQAEDGILDLNKAAGTLEVTVSLFAQLSRTILFLDGF
ncbi:hypothetical protein ES319_D13G258700v1 [Gossypium barbadense]|uniref:E2F/DP family winged-helix DNA-binding domain-containing protein n=1 Tax=Gossypium barbadense TaxID=3634 RepID=A0A5J5NRC0_GOSBA|nr:hypothetical protein ES319_D13G258700v1 [Gossypium barbadense]